MVRCKYCSVNRSEVNPFSAILNFGCVCLVVGAIFSNWILLESVENNESVDLNDTSDNPLPVKHSLNELADEFAVANCTHIGSQLFLLPARFSMVKHNGTNHIFYQYDNQVYIDCISPVIADYFYLITAFCFVAMSISTFATLLHAMTPPFSFFNYLRAITALEMVICVTLALILILVKMAKNQVESLQVYTNQNRLVSTGLAIYSIIGSSILTLSAALIAQLRQYKIRMDRREENKRLMCTRPLRSRREVVQSEYDPQPIAELERYLLEPGLRCESINTVSTVCVDDLADDQREVECQATGVDNA